MVYTTSFRGEEDDGWDGDEDNEEEEVSVRET